jgi:hypothetical protein
MCECVRIVTGDGVEHVFAFRVEDLTTEEKADYETVPVLRSCCRVKLEDRPT